jgi:NSS family neurotransmitter:Na+ symporter
MEDNQKRSSFSNKVGYVLATAGASVGLGNIWRFPYLAAKYGGGAFLVTYLILAFTFGYTLIISETALGRMTGKSPVGAYHAFSRSGLSTAGGWINAVIPMLIVPYYSVIGGWVIKYLFEYLRGNTKALAGDSYFGSFITSNAGSELWFLIFAALVILVIVAGVQNGIERVSRIMMPMLVVLAVIVAIYSMTRPGAVAGIKYFLVPDFSRFSWMTVVAALGQMFYSLSIAMGILITFGSYMKKDVDIEKSSVQVAVFDSAIAILAGLMIIPAVFAFSGGSPETLNAGPSLMFITIPKVFASMGLGTGVGVLFFLLVFFAAITSAIALAETSTSTFQDELGWSRKKSALLVFGIMIVLGSLSSVGYGALADFRIFGMQMLDFFDFLSNSLMMPIAAFATCILVTKVVGRDKIEEEVMISSEFKGRRMYFFMSKYIAPVFVIVILLSSIASVLGLLTI